MAMKEIFIVPFLCISSPPRAAVRLLYFNVSLCHINYVSLPRGLWILYLLRFFNHLSYTLYGCFIRIIANQEIFSGQSMPFITSTQRLLEQSYQCPPSAGSFARQNHCVLLRPIRKMK